MASLSLLGKGVANGGGGRKGTGGAGKGNNPWKGSIVQITGLALKKKVSPKLLLHNTVILKLRN